MFCSLIGPFVDDDLQHFFFLIIDLYRPLNIVVFQSHFSQSTVSSLCSDDMHATTTVKEWHLGMLLYINYVT